MISFATAINICLGQRPLQMLHEREPLPSCHWSYKGRNQHLYRKQIIWLSTDGLTAAICFRQKKKRPWRVQPIWSLNWAVTNSSDSPVGWCKHWSKASKTERSPGQALHDKLYQTFGSVCQHTNFQLSTNVESELRDYRINAILLFSLVFLSLFALKENKRKPTDSNASSNTEGIVWQNRKQNIVTEKCGIHTMFSQRQKCDSLKACYHTPQQQRSLNSQ